MFTDSIEILCGKICQKSSVSPDFQPYSLLFLFNCTFYFPKTVYGSMPQMGIVTTKNAIGNCVLAIITVSHLPLLTVVLSRGSVLYEDIIWTIMSETNLMFVAVPKCYLRH